MQVSTKARITTRTGCTPPLNNFSTGFRSCRESSICNLLRLSMPPIYRSLLPRESAELDYQSTKSRY